jgi:MscS family membrane protein
MEMKILAFKNNLSAPRSSFSVTMLCVLLLYVLGSTAGSAQDVHPLAPPDTSSPRATLKTFLDSTNKALEAFKRGQRAEARQLIIRAARCMNLEQEAPSLRYVIGLSTAIYLKEVLDRIDIPPDEDIPDEKTVQTQKISSWTIPYTEITIAAVKEGSSAERFLFTKDTVRNAEKFYDKVEKLPYRPGTGGGALYQELISTAGPIIPKGFIDRLPNWAKAEVYNQALWQWIGLALYFLIGAAIGLLIYHYSGKALALLDRKFNWNLKGSLVGLILPVTLILFANAGLWFAIFVLHIINSNVYLPIAYVLTFLSYLGAVWLIGVLLNRVADLVIAMGRFSRGDMDVQLIRLGFQILTVVVVILAIINLGSRLGLPTYSLVTGLGIGGIAVALAGREALSNLIGTLMIILDRPFKIGDYIDLSDGERGAVAEVGFRSTRIRTRDDILISIPNSVMANSKMINESAPVPLSRIRVKLGVAYGSDLKKVEEILLSVAHQIETVVAEPAPRIRFRRFGDSALEFELLCWIDLPELKGRTTHQLNWAIHEEFRKHGIEMPFPQRDVHIRTSK